jgi:hypothetical protein
MKNCQPMKVHLQVIVETHRFSTGEIIGGDAAPQIAPESF